MSDVTVRLGLSRGLLPKLEMSEHIVRALRPRPSGEISANPNVLSGNPRFVWFSANLRLGNEGSAPLYLRSPRNVRIVYFANNFVEVL